MHWIHLVFCFNGFESITKMRQGWRVRLLLATAVARSADVLLLDEPTNHLDLQAQLFGLKFCLSMCILDPKCKIIPFGCFSQAVSWLVNYLTCKCKSTSVVREPREEGKGVEQQPKARIVTTKNLWKPKNPLMVKTSSIDFKTSVGLFSLFREYLSVHVCSLKQQNNDVFAPWMLSVETRIIPANNIIIYEMS